VYYFRLNATVNSIGKWKQRCEAQGKAARTEHVQFVSSSKCNVDLPGKSGGTSDRMIATGELYDDQAETRIYDGV
jgi:hypothetical protein